MSLNAVSKAKLPLTFAGEQQSKPTLPTLRLGLLLKQYDSPCLEAWMMVLHCQIQQLVLLR